MAAVAAALVSAKTLPYLFGVVLLAFLVSAALRGRLGDALPRRYGTVLLLAPFPLYAVLSSAWAMAPEAALVTSIYGLLVAAASVLMVNLVTSEQRMNLLHMGEGLWLGFLLALFYLAVELATGQGIKIFLYNLAGLQPNDLAPPQFFQWSDGKLVAIVREDLTRNMAPLTLFLWPVVAAIMGSVTRRYAALAAVALVLASAVIVMVAWHETSKLAIVVGTLVFFAARYAPKLMVKVVAVAWVVTCLGVLPAALTAQRAGLHEASWLQASARHRIIIWNATAERALNSPFFGVGARTTYFLGPSLEKDIPPQEHVTLMRTLSTHAHNVFLQTWFELGLVGALLLSLFGVALVRAIGSLETALQPYALATFVTAAAMAGSSYSLWQYWFLAMFGLTAVCCRIGLQLLSSDQSPVRQTTSTVANSNNAL